MSESVCDADEVTWLEPSFKPWVKDHRPGLAVMMSGGVDSSLTALLLREEGWNVLGLTLKIPAACSVGYKGVCCGAEAAFICQCLDIPHYFLDVQNAFFRHVIDPFRNNYATGRTPNPCIDCNTDIKFRLAWDAVEKKFGITDVATGHYARIKLKNNRRGLYCASNKGKDQSYFLYGIPVARLEYLHLPIGDMSKDQVRALARQNNLSSADRSDSMELCFADEADYRKALGGKAGIPGQILHISGQHIGTHSGLGNYTVGQRKGLGVRWDEPLYVLKINVRDNDLVVAERDHLQCRNVQAEKLNVLQPEMLKEGNSLLGKIRSGGKAEPCEVVGMSGTSLTVSFNQPVFAPAPGQRLVLYDEDEAIVAGGEIMDCEQ